MLNFRRKLAWFFTKPKKTLYQRLFPSLFCGFTVEIEQSRNLLPKFVAAVDVRGTHALRWADFFPEVKSFREFAECLCNFPIGITFLHFVRDANVALMKKYSQVFQVFQVSIEICSISKRIWVIFYFYF